MKTIIPGQRRGRAAERGLILVEALAAVAILSVSIVIILQSLTAASKSSALAGTYVEASNLLENKAAEFLISPRLFVDGKTDTVTGSLQDYRFHVTRGDAGLDNAEGLQSVALTAAWGKNSSEKEVRATMLYPSLSETAASTLGRGADVL